MIGSLEDVSQLSFEAALAELTTLTQQLEKGEVPLADALQLHQRARALSDHTARLLEQLTALA
ncbi:MAG: exodeoxyribonuclease VII small subunit [Sulfobacillus benefaciens]|uniref:Exodeoxyribonuclease VII small subunit n=1 Tax=Sulfobacillus benefaciens TaxID=453960 RepID=A0A2T2X6P5_9FIRM|nr:MAG: exodeoxyribonuclease VII small subunit [Sulfobacillus benefaciens]